MARTLLRLPSLLVASLALALVGCGGGPAGSPPAAGIVAGKPVGLYFMTRYSSFSGLEKKVWYFSPEGVAYEGLMAGFSPADLAAHQGRTGTMAANGDKLAVTWANGKGTVEVRLEVDKDGVAFGWDMGSFVPIQPFADAAAVTGSYEGGESSSFAGNSASAAFTCELKGDGTFTWDGIGSVSTRTESSKLTAGSTKADQGTWKLDGWSLVRTYPDGRVDRRICFPIDYADTPANPDLMVLGGIIFKKR